MHAINALIDLQTVQELLAPGALRTMICRR